MRKNILLITNNPCFQNTIEPSRLAFIGGTSLDVLISARDAVHLGSSLLTHPLYGNLRPNQQPFRSILIQNANLIQNINLPRNTKLTQSPAQDAPLKNFSPDPIESISTIEEAVLLYQSYGDRLIVPGNMPDAVRLDYSFVDSELMRESLVTYGLL